jgi:hypothetical protein
LKKESWIKRLKGSPAKFAPVKQKRQKVSRVKLRLLTFGKFNGASRVQGSGFKGYRLIENQNLKKLWTDRESQFFENSA